MRRLCRDTGSDGRESTGSCLFRVNKTTTLLLQQFYDLIELPQFNTKGQTQMLSFRNSYIVFNTAKKDDEEIRYYYYAQFGWLVFVIDTYPRLTDYYHYYYR